MAGRVRPAGRQKLSTRGSLVFFATALCAAAAPVATSAQNAQLADEPAPSSMIVLREVPTRPAQAIGTGETLEVQMAPTDAFTDAIDLGIAELDDATAALITSSALAGFNQLSRIDDGSAATDTLIAQTLDRNGLGFLEGAPGSNAGSIASGSIDSSLAATNSAISSALGSVNGALGGLNGSNGGGQ